MIQIALAMATVAALRVPGPLSLRNASYRLSASLDEKSHLVTGRAQLTWRNVAAAPADELVFHLYMNAFKNEQSTFWMESHGEHRRSKSEKHGWGLIDVTRVRVGGVDLTARWIVDDTLAFLALSQPIAAGATVEIELEFTTRLPRIFARTGYVGDFFAVGQWFPKIGVFDGAWRAHQHHLNSEFFADFGVYDVELDVPSDFVVGATGVEVPPVTDAARPPGRKQVRFHAEDVTDFAWFASKKFHDDAEAWRDVRIRLLSWPGHEAQRVRHFAAAKAGLAELERRLGPYPYAQLTIIDVPDDAEGAGGMEYPTLFTTLSWPVPDGIHLLELVTVHELAHQYFQGMVSSDEVEEAWLDEGFTEAMTDFGLSAQFGRSGSFLDFAGHRLSHTDGSRLGYRRHGDIDPPALPSFAFLDNGSYGTITYAKTNLILRTVEGLLGPARFEAGMRRYFEGWRFAHPRRDDFLNAFKEGAGADLGPFFHATLDGSELLDYEVLGVSAERTRPPAGLYPADGGVREVEPPSRDSGPWRSEVVVHRRGTLVFPVEARVVFADGSERRERWDDVADGPRWMRWQYQGAQPVAFAEIDPEHKVALDVSRLNDGLRREPDAAPRRRALGMVARVLSALLGAVGF
jgi:hypothetical protein